MFWLLSFILLGIVSAPDPPGSPETSGTTGSTTTPTPTTVAPTTKESNPVDDINQMLRDIIRTYEEDFPGNAELTTNLKEIRSALKLGNEDAAKKTEALIKFNVYNEKRKDLEKNITERIDNLNNLLPTLTPNSRCSDFYLKQRKVLKEIGKLSNAEKEARWTENSVVCPNADSDNDDYFYIDDLYESK